MRYTPNTDFQTTTSGTPDTVTVQAWDYGHTGTGGELTATASVAVTVTAVPDPITLALATYVTGWEDLPLSVGLTLTDHDSLGSTAVNLHATALHGTLGVTALVGTAAQSGNGTSGLTLTGPIADLVGTVANLK